MVSDTSDNSAGPWFFGFEDFAKGRVCPICLLVFICALFIGKEHGIRERGHREAGNSGSSSGFCHGCLAETFPCALISSLMIKDEGGHREGS